MAKKRIGLVERVLTQLPNLNEKQKREMLALEALSLEHGGIRKICEISGKSRTCISNGIKKLINPQDIGKRVRQKGGGRKPITDTYPVIESVIKKLIEPDVHGDPESPLRWVSKSTRKIAAELNKMGYAITHTVVAKLLKKLGFSLQANRKRHEGSKKNPDRNAQFNHINEKSKEFMREGQPVVSIDTKKKELVGNYKNNGSEYAPKGQPIEVNAYDFPSDALCRAIPYGIYDIVKNEGWVNVGISNDTAQFAVGAIKSWWNGLGRISYPNATKLMITADCGGSNGSRVRLFKVELQKLANELNIDITVCHFPPGTSKWNKIEHRLFSFISQNWRGKPLEDLVTIVNLIGNTRTNAGLKVCCELDEKIYETGIKISTKEIAQLNILLDQFHGEWNYTIMHQNKRVI